MHTSKDILSLFLSMRNLVVDSTALRVLKDNQLIRLWNRNGDLIYYNEQVKKATSYSPLDLCLYDLKTLWSFEDDGYERFKAVVMRGMMGQSLGKESNYIARENMGERLYGHSRVELATPFFQNGHIEGILLAGSCEVYAKPK